MWVHICIDPVGLEDLVSLVSSIPSGSYTFSVLTSAGFADPQGELMETFPLGVSVPHIVCGSLHLFPLQLLVYSQHCLQSL